jgi:hypothetical protein
MDLRESKNARQELLTIKLKGRRNQTVSHALQASTAKERTYQNLLVVACQVTIVPLDLQSQNKCQPPQDTTQEKTQASLYHVMSASTTHLQHKANVYLAKLVSTAMIKQPQMR